MHSQACEPVWFKFRMMVSTYKHLDTSQKTWPWFKVSGVGDSNSFCVDYLTKFISWWDTTAFRFSIPVWMAFTFIQSHRCLNNNNFCSRFLTNFTLLLNCLAILAYNKQLAKFNKIWLNLVLGSYLPSGLRLCFSLCPARLTLNPGS